MYTLAFPALLGAPYIYDTSSLRVNINLKFRDRLGEGKLNFPPLV